MSDEDFRALYAQLQQVVFSYAARRLTPQQAMDVVHNTFEVVLRKRRACPARREEWVPWVMGIARKQVLQEGQRTTRKHHDNRFIADVEGQTDPLSVDVADVVADSEVARSVWRRLAPADRQLLNVAFVRLLRPEEGAALLGISVSAYATRLTRLRRKLTALHEGQVDVSAVSDKGEPA